MPRLPIYILTYHWIFPLSLDAIFINFVVVGRNIMEHSNISDFQQYLPVVSHLKRKAEVYCSIGVGWYSLRKSFVSPNWYRPSGSCWHGTWTVSYSNKKDCCCSGNYSGSSPRPRPCVKLGFRGTSNSVITRQSITNLLVVTHYRIGFIS
jgi:hypothetical protein